MIALALLLPPFFGFLFNSLTFKSSSKKTAGLVACLAPALSFCATIVYVFLYGFKTESSLLLWNWMSLGELNLSVSFLLDPLSLLMSLLITGVGSLIHLYSFFYMSKDPGWTRYFSYLNLFIFMMLILVLSDNLPLLFVGWEGVGLCSYLLIGFWFKKEEKVQAGFMAFIVNRIGDACLLLGAFLLFSHFKSFQFADINLFFQKEGLQVPSHLALPALLLFFGAVGKSAQIPLYFWLPKAMAGPTPVSALIHAATMVTAGVYLLIRLSHFYMAFPDVLSVIAWVGAFTALGSAFIACKTDDLKGVLAYSTISQLAYLFMALGVQAFSASLFHLLTHGFFKALLFLCAASVIKALSGEQNIKKMGGLAKDLPFTFRCYLAGTFALMALPPFSGFFSKDEILWSLFASSHYALFSFAFVIGFFTCFYMTRLSFYVFFGEQKTKPSSKEQKGFYVPLMILALLSVFSGVMGVPHLFSEILPFHPPHLLHEILKSFSPHTFKGALWQEALLMLLSTGGAVLVITLTFYYYRTQHALSSKKTFLNKGGKLLENAFYVPYLIENVIQASFVKGTQLISKRGEEQVFSQMVPALNSQLLSLRKVFSLLQNSNLQSYALYFTIGLTVLILLLFFN